MKKKEFGYSNKVHVKSASIPNDTTGLPISLQNIIPPSYCWQTHMSVLLNMY